MKAADRKKLLFAAGGFVLAGVLGWALSQQEKPEPDDPSYYTGVRFNHRNGLWVDGDGRVVPKPAGQPDLKKMDKPQVD